MIRLLDGVRVVECAVLFNGDQTSRILGDLGADVIKVEAPGVGDYLRDFLGQITPHHSPAHMYVNRNKRSITLNLRVEEGRAVFFDLLRTADIFVDGFAGDACDRLGIGYDAQRAVKPDIIYAQCSGFGAHGPYAQIPTHGQMMGALGGGASLEVGSDGLVKELGGLTDGTVVGATNTALTALAALQQRTRTGDGAYIDGSGADAVLATNWYPATYTWNDDRLTNRAGMSQGGGNNPKYHFYATKDDRFMLFCGIEEKFWRNFCNAVGRTDLLAAHNAAAPVDFASDQPELAFTLADIFRSRTQAEWIDVAIAHDIAMGPAHLAEDLAHDPQLRDRRIVNESTHPAAGPFTSVGWPAVISGQPFEITKPAPALGEHQLDVLAELGYTEQTITELRQQGIM